jgi:hypothetical protein
MFINYLYWPKSLSLATTDDLSIDFYFSGYLDVSIHQLYK